MLNFSTKQMVIIALMVAMEIVLTRFLSIETPIIRLSFGFVAIAVVAMLYGPVSGAMAAVLAVIIGINFFSGLTPHPGLMLTALLMGYVYGIFMHKHIGNRVRIIAAAVIVTVVLQLGLDTLWLQMITGTSYMALLGPRLIRTAIMLPIQIVLITAVARILSVDEIRRIAIQEGRKI